MKRIKKHGRRIGVILLHTLFGRIWFFRFVGWFTQLFGVQVKTVFLLYPASEKYTLEYVYLWFAKKFKWSPILSGFFKQNGKWGVTFAISASEKEIRDHSNIEKLRELYQKLEQIKNLVGADQKTFAGILPSILSSRGILDGNQSVEKETTIQAVLAAIEKTLNIEGLSKDSPIMVLGGAGFIGSGLSKITGNKHFYYLDLSDRDNFHQFHRQYQNQPALILNLTKKGALGEYIPLFWPEIILINEVYPEPSRAEVAALKSKGVTCYHIAGVKAKAWPAFPRGYEGGIPCCASFLPDKEGDDSFEVLIRKM
jgi:hypothetical protein